MRRSLLKYSGVCTTQWTALEIEEDSLNHIPALGMLYIREYKGHSNALRALILLYVFYIYIYIYIFYISVKCRDIPD